MQWHSNVMTAHLQLQLQSSSHHTHTHNVRQPYCSHLDGCPSCNASACIRPTSSRRAHCEGKSPPPPNAPGIFNPPPSPPPPTPPPPPPSAPIPAVVTDEVALARLAAALVSLPDPASPKPAAVTKVINGEVVTLTAPQPAPAEKVVSVPDTTPPSTPISMGIVLAGGTVYVPLLSCNAGFCWSITHDCLAHGMPLMPLLCKQCFCGYACRLWAVGHAMLTNGR